MRGRLACIHHHRKRGPGRDVAQVKEAQSKFIKRRDACDADVDCLVSAHTDEMMFLRNVKSNLGL